MSIGPDDNPEYHGRWICMGFERGLWVNRTYELADWVRRDEFLVIGHLGRGHHGIGDELKADPPARRIRRLGWWGRWVDMLASQDTDDRSDHE